VIQKKIDEHKFIIRPMTSQVDCRGSDNKRGAVRWVASRHSQPKWVMSCQRWDNCYPSQQSHNGFMPHSHKTQHLPKLVAISKSIFQYFVLVQVLTYYYKSDKKVTWNIFRNKPDPWAICYGWTACYTANRTWYVNSRGAGPKKQRTLGPQKMGCTYQSNLPI
jgi:hypothetical protein